MSTIWWTVEHTISACPTLVKEKYTQKMIKCVCNYILTYGRKWVKIIQRTLV
jgi:hypothetical protein